MNVLGMIAAAGAVIGLWTGATKYRGSTARGYRWLGAAALFWLVGLIIETVPGGQFSSPAGSLSLADLAPLLALALLAVGIMVLASGSSPGSMAGLADGYVMAIALLVVGWVVAFGAEFHHSGERPETFLINLLHPLTDLAVLGALLPVLTVAWDRVLMPYLSLLVLTGADSLGVGVRISGAHEGILEQLAVIVAACLLGLAPWLDTIAARLARGGPAPGVAGASAPGVGGATAGGADLRDSDSDGDGTASVVRPAAAVDAGTGGPFGGRYVPVTSSGAATIIAALAVVIAAFAVIANGLSSAPASGLALVIAGGAAVLVIAVRILMLVKENGVAIRMWRDSGESLRDLAVRTGDIVLLCDLDGIITYASPAVSGFSYPEADLVGKALADFVHPEDLTAARSAIRAALSLPPGEVSGGAARVGRIGRGGAHSPSGRFSCRVRAADGTWRHIECAVLLYNMPGEDARMLVTARDVSDQVALRQQVAHLTFHDGLTGLPNRAYVEERARDALAVANGEHTTGVIFLDLDGFTGVNDLVGHGAGDLVLAQAARRLRAAVPADGTVARWGGDEFAVLMENAAGPAEVAELADRLAGVIAAGPFRAADREIRLTASVGVALADGSLPDVTPADGGQPSQTPQENLLRNADVAMARAKDSGGARVEVYAAHMHADVVRRVDLAGDLQRALDREELTLQYQPIVELATSRVTGAEALVRWWRGDELVQPREFLAVAEDSGMVVALGDWVLREACAQGAAWRASAWDVGVSVNLSLRQLNAPQAVARVAEVLRDTGLPPAALTLEVNERVLVEDAGLVTGRLAELRGLGIRLAIDDFGTGYASLAHLRQLPVDIIKIDPSFVAGLGTDPTVTMLTKTIVQVGRDLGIEVVAEGIEQPRQMTELREMGCGYGQGFLVARPMAAPGVEALIRTSAGNPKPGVPAA